MSGIHHIKLAIALTTSAAIVFAGIATKDAFARGGGHGGGHHGGHHGHHPYHPSHHHTTHHDRHHNRHHDHHHYQHHHHSWHHGGWGPAFLGGLGLGAVGGYYGGNYWGGGGYGGNTYVDNSATTTATDASTQNTTNNTAQTEQQPQGTSQGANANGFPADDWPELGVVTYAGQYGRAQGMVVVRVVPNSPAARAGIVPGDVILKLNNQPTPSADALETVLDSAKGNFEALVWDARTGRQSTLSGTLDPAPADLGKDDDDDAAAEQPQTSASGPAPKADR